MKTQGPPSIDAKKLTEDLASLGFAVNVVESTGSTNDDLKKEAGRLPHYSVLIAETQTKGRGRQDRSFVSQQGKGIYLSVLLKAECRDYRPHQVPLMAALACAQMIEGMTSLKADIKWPNDLLIQGKKVVGILCESQVDTLSQRVDLVLGIGINVHVQTFDPELSQKAQSLADFTDQDLDRNALIVDFLKRLDLCLNLDFAQGLKDYRRYLKIPKMPIRVIEANRSYMAEVVDIDEEGCLYVLDEFRLPHRLISEEVHLS